MKDEKILELTAQIDKLEGQAEEAKREAVAGQTEPDRQRDLILQFRATALYKSIDEKL